MAKQQIGERKIKIVKKIEKRNKKKTEREGQQQVKCLKSQKKKKVGRKRKELCETGNYGRRKICNNKRSNIPINKMSREKLTETKKEQSIIVSSKNKLF